MECMQFHVRAELCLFERQEKREYCTVFGKKLVL